MEDMEAAEVLLAYATEVAQNYAAAKVLVAYAAATEVAHATVARITTSKYRMNMPYKVVHINDATYNGTQLMVLCTWASTDELDEDGQPCRVNWPNTWVKAQTLEEGGAQITKRAWKQLCILKR
jgi:hypothetical protein